MRCYVREPAVDVAAELVEPVISERSVKADDADVRVLVHELNAVEFKLTLEPLVAKQEHACPTIVVKNILAGHLAARINLVAVRPEPELVEPCDIVRVHTRAVVGEEANALAHLAKLVDCGKRTVDFVVADIHCAVEVKHKQFYVFDVFHNLFLFVCMLSVIRPAPLMHRHSRASCRSRFLQAKLLPARPLR